MLPGVGSLVKHSRSGKVGIVTSVSEKRFGLDGGRNIQHPETWVVDTDFVVNTFNFNLLGDTLWFGDGHTVRTSDVVRNKMTLLYFAAPWCPACHKMTPKLSQLYSNVPGVEIVYIYQPEPSEITNSVEYHRTMPFARVHFVRGPLLMQYFNVDRYPTLILLDCEGRELSRQAEEIIPLLQNTRPL